MEFVLGIVAGVALLTTGVVVFLYSRLTAKTGTLNASIEKSIAELAATHESIVGAMRTIEARVHDLTLRSDMREYGAAAHSPKPSTVFRFGDSGNSGKPL